MYKIYLILAVFSTILCSNALADDVCKKEAADMYCTQGTVDKINFFGSVHLDGTTVLRKTYVFGSFNSENAELNNVNIHGNTDISSSSINDSLQVLGDANIRSVTIVGETNVTGNFTADNFKARSPVRIVGVIHCKECIFSAAANFIGDVTFENSAFNSNLEMVALESSFLHTQVKDVFIKNNTDEPQTIILANNSVAQNITFENQKGVVMLSRDSKITGTVKGGFVKPLSK
jgi:hypothetical protein